MIGGGAGMQEESAGERSGRGSGGTDMAARHVSMGGAMGGAMGGRLAGWKGRMGRRRGGTVIGGDLS